MYCNSNEKVKWDRNDKKQCKFLCHFEPAKLYSNYTNLTWFSYNSDEKIIFQNSEKLSPVFRNIRDSFFKPIILITKLSNV